MKLTRATRSSPARPGDVRVTTTVRQPQLIFSVLVPPDDGFAARSPRLGVVTPLRYDEALGAHCDWTAGTTWMSREPEETLALDGG